MLELPNDWKADISSPNKTTVKIATVKERADKSPNNLFNVSNAGEILGAMRAQSVIALISQINDRIAGTIPDAAKYDNGTAKVHWYDVSAVDNATRDPEARTQLADINAIVDILRLPEIIQHAEAYSEHMRDPEIKQQTQAAISFFRSLSSDCISPQAIHMAWRILDISKECGGMIIGKEGSGFQFRKLIEEEAKKRNNIAEIQWSQRRGLLVAIDNSRAVHGASNKVLHVDRSMTPETAEMLLMLYQPQQAGTSVHRTEVSKDEDGDWHCPISPTSQYATTDFSKPFVSQENNA